MKTHFRIFLSLFLLSSLLLTACGPAPNPKLQAKSAEESPDRAADQPKEQERVAVVEQPVPARVEELPPQNLPKPKQQLPKQPIARQTANRPGVSSQSGIDQKPLPAPVADTVSSSAPGTITLPAPAAPPVTIPAPPPDETEARPIDRPVEPPAPKRINVPSGTLVAVRMIDSVNSETSRVDETFKASLDEAIVLDGETVFPEGAEVYVKLARVQSAGRVKGQSELELRLDRIFLGKRSYSLESNAHVVTGASQGGRTAKSAGIGAAIGAAIGAISGGGKGAVIGGATGAGAGAGVEAIRKGEQVRVDSETKLVFRLEDSLQVTLESSSLTPQRHIPSGPARLGTRQN